MPAWTFVDVVVPPGILGDIVLEIRPVPVLRVARLLQQILEAVLALRIRTHVDVEGFECG